MLLLANGALLGTLVEGKPYWFRQSVKRHTNASEFNIENIKGDALPTVQIVYGSDSMLPDAYEAYAKLVLKRSLMQVLVTVLYQNISYQPYKIFTTKTVFKLSVHHVSHKASYYVMQNNLTLNMVG